MAKKATKKSTPKRAAAKKPKVAAKAKPAKAIKRPSLAKPAKASKVTKPAKPARPARPASPVPAIPSPVKAPKPRKPAAPVPAPEEPQVNFAAEPLGTSGRPLDLATIVQRSRMFFAGHRLASLAAAIPDAASFGPEARESLVRAAQSGLDDALAFPPVALQRESIHHLSKCLAEAGAEGLNPEQQYGQPWLYQVEQLKDFAIRERPQGAYVLCVSGGRMALGSMGLDARRLRLFLAAHACSGLTAYEYLVLQRLRAEQHGDHRFDATDGETPQGQWLMGMSLGEGKDERFVTGSWNARMRRVEVGWCGPGDASPKRGVHAARVVHAGV